MWQYDTVTTYDPSTGDGGLFAQYMNTFMKKKKWMQLATILIVIVIVITLRPYDISFNAGRHTVAKLCRNNIWGKIS